MKDVNKGEAKWTSEDANNLESYFSSLGNLFERVNFLIIMYRDLRENWSDGEYDSSVIIEEREIRERQELNKFLLEKFIHVENEMNVIKVKRF